LEQGEECDGGFECKDNCTRYTQKELDRIQQQLCLLNGNCLTSSNILTLPSKLPSTGPDDEYLNILLKKQGYKILPSLSVNTDTIDWYKAMDPQDQHYQDPIYWIKNILPSRWRDNEAFIVLPSIGTVSPIQHIKDRPVITSFMMGNAK